MKQIKVKYDLSVMPMRIQGVVQVLKKEEVVSESIFEAKAETIDSAIMHYTMEKRKRPTEKELRVAEVMIKTKFYTHASESSCWLDTNDNVLTH